MKNIANDVLHSGYHFVDSSRSQDGDFQNRCLPHSSMSTPMMLLMLAVWTGPAKKKGGSTKAEHRQLASQMGKAFLAMSTGVTEGQADEPFSLVVSIAWSPKPPRPNIVMSDQVVKLAVSDGILYGDALKAAPSGSAAHRFWLEMKLCCNNTASCDVTELLLHLYSSDKDSSCCRSLNDR